MVSSTTKLKKLSLTVGERLRASYLLNEFKGSLDKLAIILEDIKQFPLSADELKAVDGTVENLPNGMQSVRWDVAKEGAINKDISIQEVTLDYLKNVIKAKSEKGEFGVGDEAILTLMSKLEN